jgi:hypothetical protein
MFIAIAMKRNQRTLQGFNATIYKFQRDRTTLHRDGLRGLLNGMAISTFTFDGFSATHPESIDNLEVEA